MTDDAVALKASARCRSCSMPIAFARTGNGRTLPLDPLSTPDGNVVIVDGVAVVARKVDAERFAGMPRYISHFATCPQAGTHRKKR